MKDYSGIYRRGTKSHSAKGTGVKTESLEIDILR
jgi:hypothetical protein